MNTTERGLLLVWFVVVLVVLVVVRAVVLAPFWIPSTSMQPDLQVDDRVVVNKLAYRLAPVHRGDVVVFDGRGSFSDSAQPRRSPVRRTTRSSSSRRTATTSTPAPTTWTCSHGRCRWPSCVVVAR